MVNLDKIDWLALLAMDNAVRLHGDSIHLFRDQRYPSAFLLSVLAQEEIGKSHLAARFVWTSKDIRQDGGLLSEKEEREFLDLLYQHQTKQGAFLNNSHKGFKLLTSERGRRIYQAVFDGALEASKQGATYVGLKRIRGKVDLKGRVQQPGLLSKKRAEQQISVIHNYLVDACVGIISDQYDFEISSIKRVLNRRLYKRLLENWPIERSTQRRIESIEKYLKKEGLRGLT